MTNTTNNKIEIRVEKLRTDAGRAKEIVRSTKSLVEAVKAVTEDNTALAAQVIKVVDVTINEATAKAANEKYVFGKAAARQRNAILAFTTIVAEATRKAEAAGNTAVVEVLDKVTALYDLQGKFKGKSYKFIATSTASIGKSTITTDLNGELRYTGAVGFEIQLATIFTDKLMEFIGHTGATVRFRYEEVLIDNEKKMIAVADENGPFEALDMRTELITCEAIPNTEDETENLEVASSTIINGFYIQVPGVQHRTFAEYEIKSAAQGRVGKWVAGELIKNGKRVSITDFLEFAELSLFSFAKTKKEKGRLQYFVMDIMKDATRPPLVMATGRKLPSLTAAAENMEVRVFTNKSGQLITLSNDRLSIAISEDIEVVLKKGFYYVLDKKSGHKLLKLDASKHNVRQVLNDGVTLIDSETYKRYISTDLGYKFIGENSFRMTTGLIKGLLVPMKDLKKISGFDMLTTSGNAKAKAALTHGKVFSPDFSVIIEKSADVSFKLEKRKVPFQVLATDAYKRACLMEVLDLNIEDYKKVTSDVEANMELFKLMTGAPDIDMETGEEKESRLFNATLKAINANVNHAKDPYIRYGIGQMLESYKDGLMAGNIQVEAKYNLMAQDIELYAYVLINNVKAELQGQEGVYEVDRDSDIVAEYIAAGNEVIEAGNVVLAKHNGKGCFTGDIVAHRFPKTHALHAAKVTAVKIGQYDKAINNRFYRSLIQFSAFDFILISMAGADCDGDQCLVIFQKQLIEGYMGDYAINRTAILDKYIDENGNVGDGVPYKAVTPLDLDLDAFSGVEGGFAYDLDENAQGELQGNAYGVRVFPNVSKDIELIAKVSHEVNKHVSARTIEGARIGQFTNIIMKMLSAIEDLETRLKSLDANGRAFRGFYDINANPIYRTQKKKSIDPLTGNEIETVEYYLHNNQRVLLEYPEYMETNVDITGNVVRVTFEEWAAKQIELIKADVLKWQWVLQYELDKNKHGGAFEKAMKTLMDLIDNPQEGCREFLFVDQEGKVVWKKYKKKFVYRTPSWLVSEDKLVADVADEKTPSKIRIMSTNLEALRVVARRKLKSVDNVNVYNAMKNIPEVAGIYNHTEANQTAFNALGQELSQVYANYSQIVGDVSRWYNKTVSGLITQCGVMPNEAALFLKGKVQPMAFKTLSDAKQTRSNVINTAVEVAEEAILTLEAKYNTTLDDAAKAITSIVHKLVYSNMRIKNNYESFSKTNDSYSLVSGFSFFWKACMPQIAKANDDEMYAFYTNAILDNMIATKSPQIQSSVRIALACAEFPNIANLLQQSFAKGNTVEVQLRKAVTLLDGGSMVDALGNSLEASTAFAMDYNLFLTLKTGAEIQIGAINRQDVAMFNGIDEATLELSNLTVTGGQNVVFATTTNVVVK